MHVAQSTGWNVNKVTMDKADSVQDNHDDEVSHKKLR